MDLCIFSWNLSPCQSSFILILSADARPDDGMELGTKFTPYLGQTNHRTDKYE